jgi:hypothetical protein
VRDLVELEISDKLEISDRSKIRFDANAANKQYRIRRAGLLLDHYTNSYK